MKFPMPLLFILILNSNFASDKQNKCIINLLNEIVMATFENAKVFSMEESIEYSSGGVISKQVLKKKSGNVTLFSFDKDQGLTEHTSPFDAMVHVLDGVAEIRIDGEPHILNAGECIIMPATVPHALHAVEPFKMVLTMIKQ